METEILQQILSEIKNINIEIKTVSQRLDSLEAGQAEIKKELTAVLEETAGLSEFRTDTTIKLDAIYNEVKTIKKNIYDIEHITGKNLSDIALLKAIK